MKVSFSKEKFDENSIEKKELILLGESVGFYSFGIYSKYQKFLIRTKNDVMDNVASHVKKALTSKLDISIQSKEDLEKAKSMLKEQSIGEWFDDYMIEEMET